MENLPADIMPDGQSGIFDYPVCLEDPGAPAEGDCKHSGHQPLVNREGLADLTDAGSDLQKAGDQAGSRQ